MECLKKKKKDYNSIQKNSYTNRVRRQASPGEGWVAFLILTSSRPVWLAFALKSKRWANR